MDQAALVLAAAAPAAGGLWAWARGRTDPRHRRAAVAGTAVGLVAGAWVLGSAMAGTPVTAGPVGPAGMAGDRLGALLAVFVLGLGVVVQAFARRNLAADPAGARFAGLSGLVVACTVVLVTASTLATLVVAWVAVGLAAAALIRHDGRPAARAASRKALRAFLAGDALLVSAAVLAAVGLGVSSLDPAALGAAAAEGARLQFGAVGIPVTVLVALGVVAAALARSAQAPFHRWLPSTLAAPTPVSALLHAGVVNGGGILLVKLSPLTGASAVAVIVALAAGSLGMVLGTAVMRTRADVKGALVWSTTGQMGFMVVQASLGLLAGAVVHIVAHGMFKATLFLGSGSVIDRRVAHLHAPAGDRPALRLLAAGGFGVVAVALAATVAGVGSAAHPEAMVLLVALAWAAVAAAAAGWMRHARRARPAATVAVLAGLAVVATGYLSLVVAAESWLATSLADTVPALAGVGVAAVLVVLAAAWLAATVLTRSADAAGARGRIATAAWLRLADLARPDALPGTTPHPVPALAPTRVAVRPEPAAERS